MQLLLTFVISETEATGHVAEGIPCINSTDTRIDLKSNYNIQN